MLKSTDMHYIRLIAQSFLYLDIRPVTQIPVLVDHPIFSSRFMLGKDDKVIDMLEDTKARKQLLKDYGEGIETASLPELFMLIRTRYHLTFFSHICDWMSPKDYGEYLAYVWQGSENPNQDANVSIDDAIKLFRKADRRYLMTDEEAAYLASLPDRIKVYRGVSVGRADKEGLSWTTNKEKALWFAHRFDRGGKVGKLLEGEVEKRYVLAYFNGRGEDELVCDTHHVKNIFPTFE